MRNNYQDTKIILNKIVELKFKELISSDELAFLKNLLYKTIINEHRKLSQLQLDVEDFIHIVYITLIEVENKYDYKTNVPLSAYTNYLLKKRILDYAKFLRRKKRLATIQAINSNRGELVGSFMSALDRDVDDFSYNQFVGNLKNEEIKSVINAYLHSQANEIDKKIITMIYEGYTQKEIIQNLNITRKQFLICKENLKKYFISLIN
ncbi:hypothetical protein SCORR_v1c00310 [Spiroplasma corruscae]|uniref:RNA polymerase sigma-70 region 2 domain-containing protein n=1 Tax=Spiroplasma corruscae TaxID=216934 RepID=A0A222EMR9_9MOLU|nr:sigma-70 family RNA polymerase sigma factor [Spiroplasma corruscae]ASP27806.1 hypothetical protein SCORR_v1c00310 [Spiroplasma corruscae]